MSDDIAGAVTGSIGVRPARPLRCPWPGEARHGATDSRRIGHAGSRPHRERCDSGRVLGGGDWEVIVYAGATEVTRGGFSVRGTRGFEDDYE